MLMFLLAAVVCSGVVHTVVGGTLTGLITKDGGGCGMTCLLSDWIGGGWSRYR